MIQSIVKTVVSAPGDRSMKAGMASNGMIASDSTSVGHAVAASNLSSALPSRRITIEEH